MDQGGGLCPSDIWAPKSETSETPVVVELEALTGSCLTLSSFRNHSPIPRSLAQKPVSCLQTAESLAFQQGPICRWYTHLAPERAAWITRVSNRSSEAKSSQTAHLAHLRGGYRDIRPKSLPSASVPRSQGHAEQSIPPLSSTAFKHGFMVNDSSSFLSVVRGQAQMHLATILAITAPGGVEVFSATSGALRPSKNSFFLRSPRSYRSETCYTESIQNV